MRLRRLRHKTADAVLAETTETIDVAMQKSIAGYRYWFHRMLDYCPLVKA